MDEKTYNKPHFVYLIGNRSLNYYKIGYARNVERRMVALNTPFSIELFKKAWTASRWGAQVVEKQLHRLFKDKHLRGEWFHDIDVEIFLSCAEFIAAGRVDLAERECGYTPEIKQAKRSKRRSKTVERPRRKTGHRDRIVLEALRSGGLEAARKVREEFQHGN